MRRIIVCLDVEGARVVKGTAFRALRDVGDPVTLAAQYETEGADELVFLDISATVAERATMLDTIRQTAERLSIPLVVGGGIRGVDDVANVLRAGADKVAINSAAVANPSLLRDAADRFGAQCIVTSIDASRRQERWEVFTHGGRQPTGLDAVCWAARCAEHGSGEILLTSIDRDGTRSGYDLAFTRAVSRAVPVPVIASGGAGCVEHVSAAFLEGEADAALVAGIVHYRHVGIGDIKTHMAQSHIPVRRSDA